LLPVKQGYYLKLKNTIPNTSVVKRAMLYLLNHSIFIVKKKKPFNSLFLILNPYKKTALFEELSFV
jgi:hypothetical protein